jgi:hypothetical protein
MAASKSKVWIVTKNGNLVEAVSTKTKAEAALRDLLAKNLKIKVPDAKAVEKDGVLEIAGTPHYRAKHIEIG